MRYDYGTWFYHSIGEKKYRVCFEYGFDSSGKRIRKHKTFVLKKDAELALSRHDVAMEDGTAVIPNTTTLKQWLEYWLNDMYAPRSLYQFQS